MSFGSPLNYACSKDVGLAKDVGLLPIACDTAYILLQLYVTEWQGNDWAYRSTYCFQIVKMLYIFYHLVILSARQINNFILQLGEASKGKEFMWSQQNFIAEKRIRTSSFVLCQLLSPIVNLVKSFISS